MYIFAHVSDIHLPLGAPTRPTAILNKRLLGYLSWHGKRKRRLSVKTLEALTDDLRHHAPDHVCITGDLTNLGLPAEYEAATAWLSGLGPHSEVSVVPGNHDVYVRANPVDTLDRWSPWMSDDTDGARFPYLRRRGPVAFFGVSSAVPTPPFLATGRIGREQLARLARGLEDARRHGCFRVVLLHHPVGERAVGRRKALSDGSALRERLREVGAELVLHGHVHRRMATTVPGPDGPIPVMGTAAASANDPERGDMAHYHLFEVGRTGADWLLRVRHRSFDPEIGRMVAAGEREIALPAARSADRESPGHQQILIEGCFDSR